MFMRKYVLQCLINLLALISLPSSIISFIDIGGARWRMSAATRRIC